MRACISLFLPLYSYIMYCPVWEEYNLCLSSTLYSNTPPFHRNPSRKNVRNRTRPVLHILLLSSPIRCCFRSSSTRQFQSVKRKNWDNFRSHDVVSTHRTSDALAADLSSRLSPYQFKMTRFYRTQASQADRHQCCVSPRRNFSESWSHDRWLTSRLTVSGSRSLGICIYT